MSDRERPADERTPTTSETLLRELAANPASPRAEAFARLYGPVLRRYAAAARIGHEPIQPADRDDLVQEVFLAVRSALPGFRYEPGRSSFRAYLRRAVRNAVLRLQRRPAPVPPALADALPAPPPAIAPAGLGTNALERIATVFEKLYEDSSDAKASIKDEFKEDEL